MHQSNNSYILEIYNSANSESNNLTRAADRIKANIAVVLLKHKLKNYIAQVN